MFCAVVEFWFAMSLLWTAQTVWNMSSLREFYWTIPHYILAIPWLAASLATGFGLLLYRWGNGWCSALRLAGAWVSAFIWFVMFFEGLVETGGALSTLGFYFAAMIWQIRIMISARRRVRAAWRG